MALVIGESIQHSRYRIDALLGQGGMGSVYQAWDRNLDMTVAIKENLDTRPDSQKQFNREANILAHLSHPNLPRVTDYFIIPDQGQYLVMDFIDGEDLYNMLKRLGHLPEPQVLTWIGQIADALAYMHKQKPPIIHRDIKPSNIRIRPDGTAVLVDFGIAKMYDPSTATTIGAKAITPGYSPPEQYGGGATDRRSDIYSLGATLYHLLTGQEPPESVQRMVKLTNMAPPSQLNQNISPELEQVILKAVEVTTDRRFQTIDELRSTLQQQAALQGSVVVAPPARPQPVTGEAPAPIAAETVVGATGSKPLPSSPLAEPVPPDAASAPDVIDPKGTRVLNQDSQPVTGEVYPPVAPAPSSQPTRIEGRATTPPAPPSPIPPVTPSPAPSTDSQTKRKIPLWMWIAGGVFLALCGLLVILSGVAVSGFLGRRATSTQAVALAATTTRSVAATLAATTTATRSPALQTLPPTQAPVASPSPMPPVETATPLAQPTTAPTAFVASGDEPAAGLALLEGEMARGIATKDGYAYVLTRQGVLYTYDLTNRKAGQSFSTLTEPIERLKLDTGFGLLRNGDTLYAYGTTGLSMIDISQANKPKLQSTKNDLTIYNLSLSGIYLIAPGAQNIAIYDVSSPSHPLLLTKMHQNGSNTMNFAAVIYKDRMYSSEYVTEANKTKGLLKVYDFSRPDNPKEIQRIDPGEGAYQLLVLEDNLIRCTTTDVELWELSVKDKPHFVGAERGSARSCIADGENIVTDSASYQIENGRLIQLATFDSQAGLDGAAPPSESFPYGSAVSNGFVFLAQPGRVLVLAKI